MAECRLTIYSRKTKCDIFTNFTGTALYSYVEHLEQKHVSEWQVENFKETEK